MVAVEACTDNQCEGELIEGTQPFTYVPDSGNDTVSGDALLQSVCV